MSYRSLGLLGALLSVQAHAQIFYSPVPSSIPVMSGYMLLLMSGLLAFIAYKKGKTSSNRLNSFVSLCLAGALASALLGNELVRNAQADGGGSTVIGFIDSRDGGSVPINESALNVFENTSGIKQRIDSVVISSACDNFDSGLIDGAPRCNPGSQVSTGSSGMCYTDCRGGD